jgi:hypothetical protein
MICCLALFEQHFSYTMARTRYIRWDDADNVHFVLDQMFSWIFTVLDHWNDSPRVDMSLHSDTLSWFRANKVFILSP